MDNELDPDLQALIAEERGVASTRQNSFNVLKLPKGFTAYARILPVELGPRKSWFARIARHWVGGRPIFCQRHSAADFNGNPKAHCPLCDIDAQYGQDRNKTIQEKARSIGAFPKWLIYLYVWEVIDDRSRTTKTAEQDLYIPHEFWLAKDSYLELTSLWERSARMMKNKYGFMDPLLGSDFSFFRDSRNGLKLHQDLAGPIQKGVSADDILGDLDDRMDKVKLPDHTPATPDEMEEAVEKAEDLILGRRSGSRRGDDRSTRSSVDEDESSAGRGRGRGEDEAQRGGRGRSDDDAPRGGGRSEPEPSRGRAESEPRGRAAEPPTRESRGRREEPPVEDPAPGREAAPETPARESTRSRRTASALAATVPPGEEDFHSVEQPPAVSSRARGATAADVLPPRSRAAGPPPPPEKTGGNVNDESHVDDVPRERRDAAPASTEDPATLPEKPGGRGAALQSSLSENMSARVRRVGRAAV